MISHFPIRHLILAISTACLTLIFSNSLLLNFTIICMGPSDEAKGGGGGEVGEEKEEEGEALLRLLENSNTTLPLLQRYQQKHRQEFSPFERSALISATAIGAIIGGLTINQFIRRFSLRATITGYCLVSAFSTLAVPLADSLLGFPALFLMRVLQGTCFPAEYVTISSVSRKWAPTTSTATFLMLISSHFQAGPLLTMPAAGHFCESSWGWAGIYYLMGALTLLFSLLFFLVFRDCPSEHSWVSDSELKQIEAGKTSLERGKSNNEKEEEKKRRHPPPYRQMLSDWALWLLLAAFFSDEIGFQIYTQLGPYYLNKVLGIDVASTGFFSALPYLLSMVTKVLGGPINDRLLARVLSEHTRIKLFAALSQYGIAVCLASMSFLPLFSSSIWLILPFYSFLNVFTGLDFLGIFRCSQTIALRQAEVLIAWESIVSSGVALFLPTIVSALAPDDSLDQWMFVLAAIALIVTVSISIFTIFGETRPRKWALETNETEKEEETEVQKIA